MHCEDTLRYTNPELRYTNPELRYTNPELRYTNPELRYTNPELKPFQPFHLVWITWYGCTDIDFNNKLQRGIKFFGMWRLHCIGLEIGEWDECSIVEKEEFLPN